MKTGQQLIPQINTRLKALGVPGNIIPKENPERTELVEIFEGATSKGHYRAENLLGYLSTHGSLPAEGLWEAIKPYKWGS